MVRGLRAGGDLFGFGRDKGLAPTQMSFSQVVIGLPEFFFFSRKKGSFLVLFLVCGFTTF